jgi:ZIP family zinc transporter
MLELIAAASLTALATGLGAIPVWALGERARAWEPALLGLAGGVMAVAAIGGLLIPALDESSVTTVALASLAGVAFLVVARTWMSRGERGSRLPAARRTALLVFAVLFVHSLPEGFAVGTAYASETEGLGLFIVVAIAVQNIPEGTSIAIPLEAAGASASRQFWAAVGTSVPQPIGAVVAYLLVEEIEGLLGASFAFAAGAMLALVVVELMPDAARRSGPLATTGFAGGALAMTVLAVALGV